LIIAALTTAGTIQIHQMQPPSPLPLPLKGLGHRIGMEAGYLVVVALVKPHALALQQVYGGDDVHGQTRR
jgi:hypothetical protein